MLVRYIIRIIQIDINHNKKIKAKKILESKYMFLHDLSAYTPNHKILLIKKKKKIFFFNLFFYFSCKYTLIVKKLNT